MTNLIQDMLDLIERHKQSQVQQPNIKRMELTDYVLPNVHITWDQLHDHYKRNVAKWTELCRDGDVVQKSQQRDKVYWLRDVLSRAESPFVDFAPSTYSDTRIIDDKLLYLQFEWVASSNENYVNAQIRILHQLRHDYEMQYTLQAKATKEL